MQGGQEETPSAAGPPRVGRVLQGQVRAVHHSALCCSPSPSSLGAKGTFPCAKEPSEPLSTPSRIPPSKQTMCSGKGMATDREQSKRQPADTGLDP